MTATVKIYNYLRIIYWRLQPILTMQKIRAKRAIHSFPQPYKLHLGCGQVHLDGWINIDANGKPKKVDVLLDLTHGIPLGDETARFIYHEHLLEHLSVDEGVDFLQECRRVLMKSGILRIAMPSLDAIIKKSADHTWRDQEWVNWPEFTFVQTRAEMLNMWFRWWGHKWLYDREELDRRLREAGFTQITWVEWGQSASLELRNLETRKDSLLICEVQK